MAHPIGKKRRPSKKKPTKKQLEALARGRENRKKNIERKKKG